MVHSCWTGNFWNPRCTVYSPRTINSLWCQLILTWVWNLIQKSCMNCNHKHIAYICDFFMHGDQCNNSNRFRQLHKILEICTCSKYFSFQYIYTPKNYFFKKSIKKKKILTILRTILWKQVHNLYIGVSPWSWIEQCRGGERSRYWALFQTDNTHTLTLVTVFAQVRPQKLISLVPVSSLNSQSIHPPN